MLLSSFLVKRGGEEVGAIRYLDAWIPPPSPPPLYFTILYYINYTILYSTVQYRLLPLQMQVLCIVSCEAPLTKG